MSKVHVHRAGNLPGNESPAYKKAIWVRKYLNTGNFNRVNLIDDSMANLKVFKSLESEYPQVDFDAYFVHPSGSMDVVSESRRRKKARQRKQNSLFSRNTGGIYGAWGPGPYGGYGYDSGYSGGSGDGGGGGESVNEKIGDVTQIVEPGDTVYSIARQNNLDPLELLKFNNMTKDTKLRVGQDVKIPNKKAKTAAPTIAPVQPVAKSKVAGQAAQPTTITGNPLENTLRNIAIQAGIKGKELAQFLAQCAHETMNFATLTEFGDDFSAYDPKTNPSKAKSLGNTQIGDGERFKGRGFIQLTGRYNYAQAGQALGLPLEQRPQLLEKPDVAAKASVWYWQNRVKPNVTNFTDTRTVTGFINPGLRGLQKRHGIFKNYLQTMQPVARKESVSAEIKSPNRVASNKNSQAVAQLKSALLAHKEKLEDANSDEVYRIIDQLMTRIAKAHKISGKELHDMWVKQYKKIPDAWILSDASTTEEDYDPNDTPPGPEFKPTMPAGTVRVDVSDVYDWYKLGQHISNLKGLGKHDFGKGPPSTILSFGSEEEEHKYIDALKKTGLSTTDIDPIDPKQPKGMRRQKTDPAYNVGENFADGRNPQDKGDSARHGIKKGSSISALKKIRSSDTASSRKKQLAHWQINMKQGRKKGE